MPRSMIRDYNERALKYVAKCTAVYCATAPFPHPFPRACYGAVNLPSTASEIQLINQRVFSYFG
jgi:hypothetical protein